MIYKLDTPLNNPFENSPTEIEVVDPAHPLYGRRFPLVSLSHSPRGLPQALVTYQRDILVRIPVSATNLSPAPQLLFKTKISFDAACELHIPPDFKGILTSEWQAAIKRYESFQVSRTSKTPFRQ